MLKSALKRGLILGLILVAIACVGGLGIGVLDLPVILIVILLVVVLGLVSYIAHNRKDDKDE